MSLVIETQFASLTVEESEISRTVHPLVLGTGAADAATIPAGDFALNLRSLDSSLPNMTSDDREHTKKDSEWINSCIFSNIPGLRPFRFRMKVTIQLGILKRAYFRLTGVRGAVFMYKGREVVDFDTPEELGWKMGSR